MRAILIFATVLAGCSSVARSPIVVPPEAVREWAYAPEGAGGGASSRYVVRMTDGRHEWEVEFPETAYGSEVRVPLRAGGYQMKYNGDQPGLTGADREMQEEERKTRKAPAPLADPMYGFVDEPLPKAKPAAPAAPTKPGRKQSYLVGVAQIRQLYDSRNYEIALVQLVDLEKDYPNDEKLLAMKGSIYRRLGRNNLARQAWERALALNPDNQVVAAALRQLAEEEERAGEKSDKANDDSGEGGR